MPDTAAPEAPSPGPLPEVGTPPVVSVLVISYNTREMTLDCLRSLRDQTDTPHEVIVVDNNSQDGSAEAIAAEFPEIDLVARPDNLGFAGGNNLAATRARGTYILLLNPDTVVLDHAIDRLVAFAERRPEAGIWGGRTVFADLSLNPDCCWQRMTLWNTFCRTSGLTAIFRGSTFFNAEAYGDWQRDSERAVDIVQGSFFLIRRAFWNELGGFDPKFFMYGEEADLCLRARTRGARPRMTPEATIIHYGGASDTVRSDKMVKLLAGKMGLINRHFPAWQKPLGRALYTAYPLSRMIATCTLGAATGNSGTRESAASWTEIWRRRRDWQKGY